MDRVNSASTSGKITHSKRSARDPAEFVSPVLVALLLSVSIYVALVLRTGRTDIHNIAFTCICLAVTPLAAAFTLAGFRRTTAPITVATIITITYYSFAVTILSALRIPVSYSGLGAALIPIVPVMAFANMRFSNSFDGQVVLLKFEDATKTRELLGDNVTIVTDPSIDISSASVVLIDPSTHHSPEWTDLLGRCYLSGIEILSWTRYMEIRLGRVDVKSFDASHISYTASQTLYAQTKRLIDILIVIITLPLTLALSACVAAFIYIRDPGQVLFVHHRRGLGGQVFRLYKFRTMKSGTGGGATAAGDNRIIPGCAFIRKVRLDELPQFYNILRGEMSLIGPRPESIDLEKWYGKEIPEYRYRLMTLPGLTGWAQVHNGYTSNPAEARVKLSYDLFYIKNLSFDLDVLILFKTVRTILLGSGAR
jgi:lipopolysaccharide/colanic/teichoic acid biosynthesis glycosyltransferase